RLRADTCQIASDLILSELRSRRRDQQVQQQQQQQDMPALVLALQSSQASSASSSLLSLSIRSAGDQLHGDSAGRLQRRPSDRRRAITMRAPAAAADDYQDSVAVCRRLQRRSLLQNYPLTLTAASDTTKMELDDDAVIDDKDAVDLSPETNTDAYWKPGRSGRLDQENLDQLVTDDLCESGGADDDRDIEFASAFLRCLRTELSSTPEAYWEALQTIGRLAETPDLDQVSFYRSALSALPAHAGCSRSMAPVSSPWKRRLLVDALPNHLSVWRNRWALSARFTATAGAALQIAHCAAHRFEKSLPVGCSTPVQSPTNNRLAGLIDDLDTTFKYFPYCLSETLSQFARGAQLAESRDAFRVSRLDVAFAAFCARPRRSGGRRPLRISLGVPRDSVFECLPESPRPARGSLVKLFVRLSRDFFRTNPSEAQKSKESGSSAATIPGERRVLRHCDNCALVSRHHMLLVEKLESRRLRHYDYACVHFPPEFRPRSDLPPAPQVDAEVVVPAYRPASSIQQRRQQAPLEASAGGEGQPADVGG
uniref:PI3K/PI4K domain-containing protein n=1 Tax=Macrostomum lignano TaxID=282301 RepID=A0A1I8FJA8_9PLAT